MRDCHERVNYLSAGSAPRVSLYRRRGTPDLISSKLGALHFYQACVAAAAILALVMGAVLLVGLHKLQGYLWRKNLERKGFYVSTQPSAETRDHDSIHAQLHCRRHVEPQGRVFPATSKFAYYCC